MTAPRRHRLHGRQDRRGPRGLGGRQRPAPWLRRIAALALLLLGWLLPAGVVGAERVEARVALVIGNAAYRVDPLDNPVNDARLVAGALREAGFAVALHENLNRRALLDALREFGRRLDDQTVAVLYYAGHGLQLRDRNYLIPVDAEIRSEDEIPIAGIDLGFMLGRMSHAKSRVNIVILDACRNNPFFGKTVAAQGLAQMDAPVGTLLAYATAPGKLAADGFGGANSLYAMHLARHLTTPGLPVEHVFKRVREAVVRETREQQVPWESSSLQGEFAFVPGVAPAALPADAEAAGELAFWNSIQAAHRADEYRAYLRQYPNGRFAALAQARLAAYTPAPAAGPAGTTPGASPGVGAGLPRPGDSWRYRVSDRFRIGDLYVTARVDAVGADGVAETWTTTSDAKVRTAVAPLDAAFHSLPGWTLAPPEFAPYLQAAGGLRGGAPAGRLARRVDEVWVPLVARLEGEEEVVTAAGRFKALKLVLRGQVASRGARDAAVVVEHVVWYAGAARRAVKSTTSTRVGAVLRESSTVELVELTLR